jgi:proteasome lid subunit RPN8/RPN11
MGMEIELTRAAMEEMLAQSARALPCEACGLLIGGGQLIGRAIPAHNVHSSPETHFEIDPQALIDAYRAARQGGGEVLGYYHSHPGGLAEPSTIDRAMATGDGRVWAIVGEDAVTFWRDDEDGFAKLSYRVVER